MVDMQNPSHPSHGDGISSLSSLVSWDSPRQSHHAASASTRNLNLLERERGGGHHPPRLTAPPLLPSSSSLFLRGWLACVCACVRACMLGVRARGQRGCQERVEGANAHSTCDSLVCYLSGKGPLLFCQDTSQNRKHTSLDSQAKPKLCCGMTAGGQRGGEKCLMFLNKYLNTFGCFNFATYGEKISKTNTR